MACPACCLKKSIKLYTRLPLTRDPPCSLIRKTKALEHYVMSKKEKDQTLCFALRAFWKNPETGT